MARYDKNNTKELKDILFNSSIHDAKLESIIYEYDGENSLKIKAFNPIFKVQIYLTFRDIGISFAIKGNSPGNNATILSLTVEEDFSYLQNYIQTYSEGIENCVYLLFQMFSGGELHIVSREVIVEIKKTGDGLRREPKRRRHNAKSN